MHEVPCGPLGDDGPERASASATDAAFTFPDPDDVQGRSGVCANNDRRHMLREVSTAPAAPKLSDDFSGGHWNLAAK